MYGGSGDTMYGGPGIDKFMSRIDKGVGKDTIEDYTTSATSREGSDVIYFCRKSIPNQYTHLR